MTGEFEPNDSRNVTGTASTPDGHWTGQSGQTPDAAGQQQQGGASQQQQGGGGQSANPQSQNAPGSSGGMSDGSSGNMPGGQQDGGSFSGADESQSGAGGQQNQLDSGSGQMGGSSDQSGMIGQVREHMTVVGPDGETCGRVDSVEGGQIKLTRHDSADGQHHYLDPAQIEAVEGDQIRLAQSPDWNTGDTGGEASRAM